METITTEQAEQAINMLDKAGSQLSLNRQDHMHLQAASSLLRRFLEQVKREKLKKESEPTADEE